MTDFIVKNMVNQAIDEAFNTGFGIGVICGLVVCGMAFTIYRMLLQLCGFRSVLRYTTMVVEHIEIDEKIDRRFDNFFDIDSCVDSIPIYSVLHL